MTVRTFMKVLAVYYVVPLGATWLVAPQSGLGDNPGVHAEFVARVLGGYLIVIAAMNWLISSQPVSLVRKAMLVNIVMNTIPAGISTVYILNGSFGASSWTGVGAHTIPIAALLYYLATTRETQDKFVRETAA